MNLNQKIKAGALQYVLVISVIIAIIIFAFISLIYLQQKMTIKHRFTKEAIVYTQMGFDYLKSNSAPYDEKVLLNFSQNEQAKTTIEKKHWGILDLAIVTSKVKNEFFQKMGLLGTQKAKREALYLKDNNQSLVLVGKTRIIGNVSLPKLGVKSGNISGVSYYGNQLIYGQQKVSTSNLPKIKNIQNLKRFIKNYKEISFENFELEQDLNIHRSFIKKTLVYEDNRTIELTNLSLNGNIIIASKSEIIVSSSSKLEDVILIAPRITIRKDVKGNFQALATKNIQVEANVVLNYPSALIVLEKENKQSFQHSNQTLKEEHFISIEKNVQVKGIVLFESKNTGTNYNSQVTIQENAIITGEVFCSKNLELSGSVIGSVYTNNFLTKKAGGIYVNHIYNGNINAMELPKQYVGMQINQVSNAVMKWVE